MRSLYRLALLALPLLSTVVANEAPDAPTPPAKETPNAFYANANDAFQDLLNALPEESLHAALNSMVEKFREGVFESDRHGIEHVHHQNPPLATKLIVAAVQDLKKRQGPAPTNGTVPQSTPSPEPQPGSSSEEPASNTPPVVVPVPVETTTDSNGQPTVVSSEILSQPTASVAVPVTRTNAQGQTEVATETKPAVIFTATNAAGQPTEITSAVDFAPTPGQVLTKTDSKGSTFLTTYTPGGGKVSSILLITTTGSDGQQSVITSYTVVDPAAATGTDGSPPPTGTNGRPGLQTGAANKNRAMEAAMVGGAVGGAFAFFV